MHVQSLFSVVFTAHTRRLRVLPLAYVVWGFRVKPTTVIGHVRRGRRAHCA